MTDHEGSNDQYRHLPVTDDTFNDVMALAQLRRLNPQDILGDAVELLRFNDVPRSKPKATTGRGRKPKTST